MRAIIFHEFGGPDVLKLVDAPIPEPTGGQVRVAVRAAGVNPADWKIRSGEFQIPGSTFPMSLGLEVAGFVDALGPEVTGLRIGEEVLGYATGGYADYALSSALVRKPAGLAWSAAAALPVAIRTADRVLALLKPVRGETLLINGASGAVGSAATQLAVAQGVTVIGTASPANQELVARLGAIPTPYGDDLVERVVSLAPNGVDAVFDAAGHGVLPAAIELRGGTDRVVTIADPEAFQLGVTFSSKDGEPPLGLLADVAQRVETGSFRLPGPSREFPLPDAAAAHRESEHGHGTGKVVLVTA